MNHDCDFLVVEIEVHCSVDVAVPSYEPHPSNSYNMQDMHG
jgi:hypothetical protein